MTSEYVPTLGEYAAVIEWLVGRKCENRWAGIAADMDEDMRPALYDAMDRAGLRRLAKFMQDTEAIITPPDESKPTEETPEPMTDEELGALRQGPRHRGRDESKVTDRYEVVEEEHSPGYPWTVIERGVRGGFTFTTWHPFPSESSARRFVRFFERPASNEARGWQEGGPSK